MNSKNFPVFGGLGLEITGIILAPKHPCLTHKFPDDPRIKFI